MASTVCPDCGGKMVAGKCTQCGYTAGSAPSKGKKPMPPAKKGAPPSKGKAPAKGKKPFPFPPKKGG